MGIFKSKEEQMEELVNEYGLDVNSYDDDEVQKRNFQDLKSIAADLSAMKWFRAGLAIAFASGDKQATVGYLATLVRQNWIIIRQNELLLRES